MKLALLGVDDQTLAAARAAPMAGCQVVWAGEVGAWTDELRRLAPDIRLGESWETLLAGDLADAVLVGYSDDETLRSDQLRKLAQEGPPLLLSHPVVASPLIYFELEALVRESGCLVLPNLPGRRHPGVAAVAELVRSHQTSPIGSVEQITFERAMSDRSDRRVLGQFGRDVDLLRAVGGELVRLGALGAAGQGAPLANLAVQMTTDQGLPVRWSVEPDDAFCGGRLVVRGAAGRAMLELPEQGEAILHIGPGDGATQQIFPASDDAVEALLRVRRAVAEEGEKSSRPDIGDALRSMELYEAVGRSLRRGRTVELKLEAQDEEQTFKGVMTSAGCTLIILALLVLVLAASAQFLARLFHLDALAEWIGSLWPAVLMGMLGLFLMLQVLRLTLTGKSEDDQASGDDQTAGMTRDADSENSADNA